MPHRCFLSYICTYVRTPGLYAHHTHTPDLWVPALLLGCTQPALSLLVGIISWLTGLLGSSRVLSAHSRLLLGVAAGALALAVDTLVGGVEAAVAPGGPLRRGRADIFLGRELATLGEQLKEAIVVNQCVPLVVDEEALRGDEDAAAACVSNNFTRERERENEKVLG